MVPQASVEPVLATPDARPPARLGRRERDHRRPGRRRPVGDRDPGLVAVEPDDRLPGRPRLGDDRRHDRRRALALVTGVPTDLPPGTLPLVVLAGLCYSAGLYVTYKALTIGKVSIVAPIVATEGAVGALIAVALGDPLTLVAALLLAVIAVGVVLSSIEPARPDVPAGDIELAADALDGPARDDARARIADHAALLADDAARTRRTVLFSVAGALIFGVGLVAAGKAAALIPPIWVADRSRFVGLAVVALPLVLQRRLVLTRAALPLVVIAGIGEIIGSTASAWGSTYSIPITAVLGSQFAAIAAVARVLPLRRAAVADPGRGRRPDRRRRHRPRGVERVTGYTPAS